MVFAMEQMNLFISKVQSDNELRAKLDALACQNPDVGKIIELASEYGFSITEEDYIQARKVAEQPAESGELSESDLDFVAGGATQNRYDPQICSQYQEAHYNCVGFFSSCWCDHFSKDKIRHGCWREKCAMGYFSYIVDIYR